VLLGCELACIHWIAALVWLSTYILTRLYCSPDTDTCQNSVAWQGWPLSLLKETNPCVVNRLPEANHVVRVLQDRGILPHILNLCNKWNGQYMAQFPEPAHSYVITMPCIILIFFPPMVWQPVVGHGLLNVEASRSHSETPHSLGLLWTRHQPDKLTSNW